MVKYDTPVMFGGADLMRRGRPEGGQRCHCREGAKIGALNATSGGILAADSCNVTAEPLFK